MMSGNNPFASEPPNGGAAAWGGSAAVAEVERPAGDIVRETVQKEKAIRDIMDLQKSLRGLMHSITSTEKESDKLKTENDMLQVYLENMSKAAALTANANGSSNGRR